MEYPPKVTNPPKKSNNNRYRYIDRYNNRYNLDTTQLDLNSNPLIDKPKLTKKQKILFESFYANQDIGITPVRLYKAFGHLSIHKNTILNFIEKARLMGWIKKLKPTKGTNIQSAYTEFQLPDQLITGQEIHDKRCIYYQITPKGINFYEEYGNDNT